MALRKTSIQRRFNYPARLKNGFEGYTSDSVVAAQDLPMVSSSKNCIDFGQADVDAENAARKIPETLCLTNHSQSDVLIRWDQGCRQYQNIENRNKMLLLAFYLSTCKIVLSGRRS